MKNSEIVSTAKKLLKNRGYTGYKIIDNVNKPAFAQIQEAMPRGYVAVRDKNWRVAVAKGKQPQNPKLLLSLVEYAEERRDFKDDVKMLKEYSGKELCKVAWAGFLLMKKKLI